LVTEGEQVVIGDVGSLEAADVAYEVLCRRHHMRRMTALTARRRSADESLWG
jgi:thymidine kinase